MRLAFTVHQFLPRHVTGTEQYVRSLARGLRARGHEVFVFAREPQLHELLPERGFLERDEEVDGVPVRRVGVRFDLEENPEFFDRRDPIVERLFDRFLVEKRPDVVHVFHARGLGAGAVERPRSAGMPVVVNLMDFWFLCPRFTLLRRDGELCEGPPRGGLGCLACIDPEAGALVEDEGTLTVLASLAPFPDRTLIAPGVVPRAAALVGREERLLEVLLRADRIVAPSRFLRDTFVRHGVPAARLEHVPYGVDPERLEGFYRRRGEGLVLGYVGSLTPHKGADVAVRAVRSLDRDDVRLVLRGDPETHPAYSRTLRRLAGDDPRIEFGGGFEPFELGRVLAAFDALVVPSLWHENTPFTVLEARHAGLPVIASDTGGIREVVADGRDGFLFEAGKVERLATLIETLLARPELLRSIGEPADRRTLADNLDDFEEIYRAVAAPACAPEGGS